ncbi:MAG: PD-(D/E)XK nuclease family protein, partial [Phycisphaerales bacterium]
MNTFIEKLAEACREHRVPEKWLIAPSLRVGHQWLDQVTRSGGPVLNVHVLTVRSLAMKILTAQLADGSVMVASPAVRRLVVAAAWRRAMKDDDYLGTARPTPGLLALAERSLLDLRMAGLGPADLDGARFEEATKGRELQKLLAEYQAGLDDRNLIDHADAARRAVEALRESGPLDIVVFRPDDLQLTVLERSLLEALRAQTVVSIPVDRPAHPATPATVESDLALLGWLDRPADAPQAVGDGSVRIVHAIGEVNEVRAVLRSCLADEMSLDTVELLYTAADTYVPLIYETAQRIFEHDPASDLGVPVTFADGVPSRMSRPGRLLAAWHSWVDQDFPQSGLLRMLQAGLLRLGENQDGVPMGTARLVRMLRSVGIGFGRGRYAPCLDEKIESVRDRLDAAHDDAARDRYGRRLATAQALAEFVKTLLAISPDRGSGAAQTVTAARKLLTDHTHLSGKLDGLAMQRIGSELDGMIDALQGSGHEQAGFDAWAWIAELPDRITIGGSGPRPGYLHVASVRSGGHSGRDRTVIVGLDDGRFPSAGHQDPLLLDQEREGLGDGLPTSRTKLHDQVEGFGRLLCRLRGHLLLSFSSRSIDDDRETFAGSAVLGCYRLVSGKRDGDHAALMDWLDPAFSFAPRDTDACLDAGEWWLHQAAGVTPVGNLPALADAAFENLARGHEAAAARESDLFTVYDGRVDEPGDELDPAGPAARGMSATALQTIGKCPLQYFYERVLGVKPPDDVEVDPTRWLNALEFGNLLHDVLFEFVGALIADDHWPPEPARDLPRMAAIIEAKVAATRRR